MLQYILLCNSCKRWQAVHGGLLSIIATRPSVAETDPKNPSTTTRRDWAPPEDAKALPHCVGRLARAKSWDFHTISWFNGGLMVV